MAAADTSLADWAWGSGSDSSTSIGSGSDMCSGSDCASDSFNAIVANNQLSALDLPGQLPSIPGGANTNGMYPGGSADPSGINSVHLSPTVNPTPTGGYMPVAAAIAAAAATGFSTYAKGSPSVAIPPPRYPGGSLTSSMLTGATNWTFVGIAVVVGIGVIAWLAFKA